MRASQRTGRDLRPGSRNGSDQEEQTQEESVPRFRHKMGHQSIVDEFRPGGQPARGRNRLQVGQLAQWMPLRVKPPRNLPISPRMRQPPDPEELPRIDPKVKP